MASRERRKRAPANGWLGERGLDEITCPRCWEKIMQEELEKDGIVRTMRRYGFTGPITRRDYVEFNCAPVPRPWTAEHEAELRPSASARFFSIRTQEAAKEMRRAEEWPQQECVPEPTRRPLVAFTRSSPSEVRLLSARNVGVAAIVIVLMEVFRTDTFRRTFRSRYIG
jgi:hypothetical protein